MSELNQKFFDVILISNVDNSMGFKERLDIRKEAAKACEVIALEEMADMLQKFDKYEWFKYVYKEIAVIETKIAELKK